VHVNVLLTHLHWDHIQGLPFFPPLLHDTTKVHVVAPLQEGMDVAEAMRRAVTPPVFPVELDALSAAITYEGVGDETFTLGGFEITARNVPHVGPTLGFRIKWHDKVITYIPDHQQPSDGAVEFTDGVLELMHEADLLIHDAQYLPEEFARRSNWGHCTTEFAVQGARRSRVKHLALFHHDPGRSDDTLDRIHEALDAETGKSMQLTTAREGLTLEI
jgi:ribonuclease BN (tRNA processing enzyme)